MFGARPCALIASKLVPSKSMAREKKEREVDGLTTEKKILSA